MRVPLNPMSEPMNTSSPLRNRQPRNRAHLTARRPAFYAGSLVGVALLTLVATGCQTPRSAAHDPALWDQARLCATLQLADEHMAAGRFERAREDLAPFQDLPDARLSLTLARVDVEQGEYAAALRRLDGPGFSASSATRRCHGR